MFRDYASKIATRPRQSGKLNFWSTRPKNRCPLNVLYKIPLAQEAHFKPVFPLSRSLVNHTIFPQSNFIFCYSTSIGPMAMSISISFSLISFNAAIAYLMSSRSLMGRLRRFDKSSMNSKILSISLQYLVLANLPYCMRHALVSVRRPSFRRSVMEHGEDD